MQYTIPFEKINKSHVEKVGGKNASLGELHKKLRSKGIKLPDGFATTAEAFRDFLHTANLEPEIRKLLNQLDRKDFSNLNDVGGGIRNLILSHPLPNPFIESVRK